jgi:CubicO group peptidase (beta-lactamase class C family)
MLRNAVSLAFVCLLALPAGADGLRPQPMPSAETLERATRFIEQRMSEQPSAGLTVGFLLDGWTWTRGFGLAIVEHDIPATADTTYRMASVTKSFTAVAAVRLAELGALDLDADVRRYVKYWPRKRWPVTTRQLLGHLGGIRHYVNCKVECHHTTRFDTKQSIEVFSARPLEYRPGAAYLYSSYGYNLAGAAMEGAARKPFAEILQEHVFGPAGMTRSHVEYDPEAAVLSPSRGYRVRSGKLVPSEKINISSRFAGGGTKSSVADMLAFARAYMDDELITKGSRELIERSMTTSDGMLTDYGLGFAVVPRAGRFVLVHGGGQPETSTLLVLFPAERFAIAMAANVEGYHGALHDIEEHLVANVLGTGRLRRAPTGSDLVHHAWARALSALTSHGVAYFKRWQRTASDSPAALFDAFERTMALLDLDRVRADPEAALRAGLVGDDPAGDSIFPIAGSFMAGTVARVHGVAHLRRYHDDPFALLVDYDAAAERVGVPPALRLPPAVLQAVHALAQPFHTASLAARELRPAPDDVDKTIEALRAAVEPAPVRPDLAGELRGVARLINGDDPERATRVLEAGLQLYPESPALLRQLAEARLDAGRLDEARALYGRWRLRDASTPFARAERLALGAKARRRKAPAAAKLLDELARAEKATLKLR